MDPGHFYQKNSRTFTGSKNLKRTKTKIFFFFFQETRKFFQELKNFLGNLDKKKTQTNKPSRTFTGTSGNLHLKTNKQINQHLIQDLKKKKL